MTSTENINRRSTRILGNDMLEFAAAVCLSFCLFVARVSSASISHAAWFLACAISPWIGILNPIRLPSLPTKQGTTASSRRAVWDGAGLPIAHQRLWKGPPPCRGLRPSHMAGSAGHPTRPPVGASARHRPVGGVLGRHPMAPVAQAPQALDGSPR